MPQCLVFGYECGMFWSASGAVATALATVVALFSSAAAIILPELARKREHLAATKEVLRAAEETLNLFSSTLADLTGGEWSDERVRYLRVRSRHLAVTLDRLINRPTLTDGVIAVGAGAISLLDVLNKDLPLNSDLPPASVGAIRIRRDPRTPAREAMEHATPAVEIIEDRIRRVRGHLRLKPPERKVSAAADPGAQ